SGTYLWLIGREAGAVSYRAKLTLTANGVTTLSLTRSNNGTDTTLATVRVPGTVAAGTTLRLRFEQFGSAPTRLRASAWPAAGAEPADWMLTTTDATAALQSPGGFGIDSYVSSSATAGQTIQVDRYSITRPGSSPPPPPPPSNVAPTAVIGTPGINGRAVTLDGSGSADTDGTVTAWQWSFGDGTTADGKNATHTYTADGTYPVILTVTDDDGASGTATASVTVAAPPPPAAEAARDAFGRNATGAWGTAETGGAWTVQGAVARYSVADGAGRQVLGTAGSTAESALHSVAATGSDTRLRIAWSRTAAAGTLYATVVPRAVTTAADYRVKVVVGSNGRPTLYPIKRVGGVETNLAMITLPITVTAATSYSLAIRLAPSGASTVLSAKLWPTGTAEPTAWQVSATDGTAALQGAGSVRLSSYLSSSATAPVTTTFDDLVISRL
uniref:PKD domain-containing protein n=1 Tax=Nakamurella sp. TaxID=1869182 RepID=UPI00378376CA